MNEERKKCFEDAAMQGNQRPRVEYLQFPKIRNAGSSGLAGVVGGALEGSPRHAGIF